MSTTPPARLQQDVIDLTSEPDIPSTESFRRYEELRPSRTSRPPRFPRNIMADVVDLEEEPSVLSDRLPSSPEVQFLGSVRTSDGSRAQSNEMRNPLGPPTLPLRSSNLADMISRIRTGAPSGYHPGAEAFRQEVALRTREFARSLPQTMGPFWIGAPPGEDIDMPIELDYAVTGFRPVDTQPAAYERPTPSPDGFTRIAKEDEIVVCPNCDHELGTGDDPVKRQIWVAKPCGHVSSLSTLFSIFHGPRSLIPLTGLLWPVYQTPSTFKGEKTGTTHHAQD